MADKYQGVIDSLNAAETRLDAVWDDTETGFRAAVAKLSGQIAEIIDAPIADRLIGLPAIPMYDYFREELTRPITDERTRILEILHGPAVGAALTESRRNPVIEPFQNAIPDQPVERQDPPLGSIVTTCPESASTPMPAATDYCLEFDGQPPLDPLPPTTTTVANVAVAADKLIANLGVVGLVDQVLVFVQLTALLVQHYRRWKAAERPSGKGSNHV